MTCQAPGVLTLIVYANDLDDVVHNWTDRVGYLYGGDGNDVLGLGGRAGTYGYGDGDDLIISGPDSDTIVGGPGTDGVSYGDGSGVPVWASLVSNTGIRGTETDSFSGIENLSGGAGNDTLWDGYGDDWLYGDAGNDLLHDISSAGYDHANGGSGTDGCWAEVRTQCENT